METLPVEHGENPLEDVVLPQTSQAVLAEADALFDAILQEKIQSTMSGQTLFAAVEIGHLRSLAQAYLDVYFNHSSSINHSIKKVREIHRRLLDIQDVLGDSGSGRLDLMTVPDMVRTCLFQCARGRKEPDEEVKTFALELWNAWESMEGAKGQWGDDASIHTERYSQMVEIKERPIYTRKWIEDTPNTPAERARVTIIPVKSSSVAKAWGCYIHFKVRSVFCYLW
jgi:hypothetical protein